MQIISLNIYEVFAGRGYVVRFLLAIPSTSLQPVPYGNPWTSFLRRIQVKQDMARDKDCRRMTTSKQCTLQPFRRLRTGWIGLTVCLTLLGSKGQVIDM
jgi:hypothetical protein